MQVLIDDVGTDLHIGVIVIVGHRNHQGLVEARTKRSRGDLPVEVQDKLLVYRLSIEDGWVASQTRHKVPPIVRKFSLFHRL